MKQPDIHQLLAAHIEATANCKRWATRGLELVEAGKIRQAKAAEKKAQGYLAEIARIEARFAMRRPE